MILPGPLVAPAIGASNHDPTAYTTGLPGCIAVACIPLGWPTIPLGWPTGLPYRTVIALNRFDAGMVAQAVASALLALVVAACSAAAPSANTTSTAQSADSASTETASAADSASSADAASSDTMPTADAVPDQVVVPETAPPDTGPETAANGDGGDAILIESVDDVLVNDATDSGQDAQANGTADTTADDGPVVAKPIAAELGPAVPVTLEVLLKPPVLFAAAAEGAAVLAQAGTSTVIASDPELPPIALTGAIGKAHSVVALAAGELLVASELGLYGAVKNKLLVSPLQAVIGAIPKRIFSQSVAGKNHLWLQTGAGMWRYDGSVAQPLSIVGTDPAALTTAIWRAGPQVAIDSQSGQPAANGVATPALWLYWQGAVQALVVQSNSAKLWIDEPIANGADLQCDGSGTVWLLAHDGTVHRRAINGSWQWLALPEPVTALVARTDLPIAALATASGLWIHQNGIFFPLLNTAGHSLRDLTSTAALVTVSTAGLTRVVLGEIKPPPPPSWATTVQPIYLAHCFDCHKADAGTVKLHNAAQWKLWYDKIVFQVDTNTMPLVGLKLSQQQKAAIKLWAKGGFAP